MFHDKKAVDKTGVMKDGVLFSKSRLLENQNVRAVGGLEIDEDLRSFTGENHVARVINKLSPIAVSISLHLHYNVLPHRGAETLYTLSLQLAKIILGRTLREKACEDDDLNENNVVYIKITSDALSFKVEYIIPSRDMKAWKVAISYKHDTEDGYRKMAIVERPVRQVAKLCDIEDSSLLDDINALRNTAKKIIDDRKIVPENEIKKAYKPEETITIEDSGDDTIDTVPSTDDVIDIVPSADDVNDIAPSTDDISKTRQKVGPKLSYLVANKNTYKFRVNFSPCSVKQSSYLIDSMPGIKDYLHEETKETDDEDLERINYAYEEDLDEDIGKIDDGDTDNSCTGDVDSTAELIEVEAEVHQEEITDEENTVNDEPIDTIPTEVHDENKVLKSNACDSVLEIDETSNLVQREMEKFLKLQDSGGDNIDNVPSPESIDAVHSPEEILEIKEKKSLKKKKSELTPSSNLSSIHNSVLIGKLSVSLSSTLFLNTTPIGYAVHVDNEEKQHWEQGRKKRDIEGLADWGRLLDTIENCDYNDKNP